MPSLGAVFQVGPYWALLKKPVNVLAPPLEPMALPTTRINQLVRILAGEDGALCEVGVEVGFFKSPVAVVEPGVRDFPLLA
jgi:hypothetical protein